MNKNIVEFASKNKSNSVTVVKVHAKIIKHQEHIAIQFSTKGHSWPYILLYQFCDTFTDRLSWPVWSQYHYPVLTFSVVLDIYSS